MTPMAHGGMGGEIFKSDVFCCEQALSYRVIKGATEHFTKAAFLVLLFLKDCEARRKKDTAAKKRSLVHGLPLTPLQCKAYKNVVRHAEVLIKESLRLTQSFQHKTGFSHPEGHITATRKVHQWQRLAIQILPVQQLQILL